MASNLVEVAKAVGGDEELIKKAAAIEGRFQVIKEMASEGERKNLTTMEDEETTNGRIPVAGRTNFEDFESEPVEQSSNRSSGRTVTEEVEIPGPGRSNESSTTSTVEYEDTNPTMEDVTNWKQDMHQSFIEENRRQQERANRRREEQESTPIFTGYTNIEDIDGVDEDSDVPVAGRRSEDDDE